jgi:hypothetical protein
MWIGKRPLRNDRRVGEHLRPARAVSRAAGGLAEWERGGTEQRKRAPDVDVVPVEQDALLLGEGADVGRDPRTRPLDWVSVNQAGAPGSADLASCIAKDEALPETGTYCRQFRCGRNPTNGLLTSRLHALIGLAVTAGRSCR